MRRAQGEARGSKSTPVPHYKVQFQKSGDLGRVNAASDRFIRGPARKPEVHCPTPSRNFDVRQPLKKIQVGHADRARTKAFFRVLSK